MRLSLHVDLVMSEIQSEDMLISSYLERRGTRYMASEHSDLGGVTRDNPAIHRFYQICPKIIAARSPVKIFYNTRTDPAGRS